MVNIDKSKFWKIAVRELYSLGFILDSDLIRLHNKHYYEHNALNQTELQYYLMVIDVMKNKELFKYLVQEEISIITNSILPANKLKFKKLWISYILDCIEYGILDSVQFLTEINKITFDTSQWKESERDCAIDIINKIRIGIIKNNPNAIEYLENPNFDVLMTVNEMEYSK